MEKLAARFRIKRQQQMIAQQEMLRQKWGLDKLEQSAAGGPAGAATDPTILKRKKAEEEMKVFVINEWRLPL